jgi:hypothetical protein
MKFKPFIFALLALLAASCERDIEILEPTEQEGEIVTIEATIPPETRVAYTDSDTPGSGGSLAWQTGDQLLLAGYDGTTYKGSSKFSYTGSGDTFSGTAVEGATTYKAYYPGNVITLDANGEVQLPADFWQQTQDAQSLTGHISSKLLLFDETANTINQTFNLTLRSSIIKFVVTLPATGSLKKMIWTVETVPGEKTRSAILDLAGFDLVMPGSQLTVYLAFDPTVMKIGPNGKVKITLIGNAASYEWSTNTTKTGGMTYEAGKRYTATITGGWTDAKTEFRFTIKTDQASQLYEIWQKESSSTSPANLTINWGDGTANTTIAKFSVGRLDPRRDFGIGRRQENSIATVQPICRAVPRPDCCRRRPVRFFEPCHSPWRPSRTARKVDLSTHTGGCTPARSRKCSRGRMRRVLPGNPSRPAHGCGQT